LRRRESLKEELLEQDQGVAQLWNGKRSLS